MLVLYKLDFYFIDMCKDKSPLLKFESKTRMFCKPQNSER